MRLDYTTVADVTNNLLMRLPQYSKLPPFQKFIRITQDKEKTSLIKILCDFNIEHLFKPANELGIFLFYNGEGQLNRLAITELNKKKSKDNYISLNDFIAFVTEKMRNEIPEKPHLFAMKNSFSISADNINA